MRRTARENAFRLIFEKIVSGSTGNVTYAVLARSMSEDEKEYFDQLTSLINGNISKLSAIVQKFSKGFDLDRIYKIDLSLLYVAMSEILFVDDVPDKVAVNEALELAKAYSTDNSPAFINGILASVIRNKDTLLKKEEEQEGEETEEGENSDDESSDN